MVSVYLDSTSGCDYLYGGSDIWKDYVRENFDDHIIISGNRDYQEIKEAEFWQDARYLVSEFENMYTDPSDGDDFEVELQEIATAYKKEGFTLDTIRRAYTLFNEKGFDGFEVDFLNILYPDRDYEEATIRGYSQGDWNNVIYDQNDETINIDVLEAFYFGKLTDCYTDKDYGSTVFTDDELWNITRAGNLEKTIRERLFIPDNEEIEIFEDDGYIQTTKWKKIS